MGIKKLTWRLDLTALSKQIKFMCMPGIVVLLLKFIGFRMG
jgi:hypothetical protein